MAEQVLLEIGCEELPASFVGPALDDLRASAEAALRDARLGFESARTLGTPRRLALLLEGVAERQEDRTLEVAGPPVSVAFDGSGKATPAAQGFAKRVGKPVEALERRPGPKGEILFATTLEPGRAAGEVLPDLLRGCILGLRFPKTMHWRGPQRFARPVRWLVALHGSQVLPVEVFGIQAGRRTQGHRIHAAGWADVPNPAGYVEALRNHVVMVDPEERRASIEAALTEAAGSIRGAPVSDPELVDEVVQLVEWPEPVVGSFDASYLELPRPVVVTAMRAHQRYFAVEGNDRTLLPHFVMIRSGRGEGHDEIRRGTQAVLRARLEDARFYWRNDMKEGLEAKVEALKGIVWHEKLGTLYDRTLRIVQTAEDLARALAPAARGAASRAAHLSKADLASEMVRSGKEFATLQGIIGAEYAAKAGEPDEVVQAIREHYLPQGPSDPLPASLAGMVVSLADRLEAVVGGFRAGLEVTGSQDPYGLRRAGNGIVRTLIERKLRLDVLSAAARVDALFAQAGLGTERTEDFRSFWTLRVQSALEEAGITRDTATAVLAVRPGDPLDVLARAKAVDVIRQSSDFEGLMVGYRRAANLVRTAEPGDVPASDRPMAENAQNFGDKSEADLHLETKMARQAVETYLQSDTPDYAAALKHLLALRKPIDAFFEAVMVMTDDAPTRRRRLGLLEAVRQTFLRIADFSVLPTAPGQKSV